MNCNAIKTPRLTTGCDLLAVIAEAIPTLEERSVLVVTSKVVSLWENAAVAEPRTRAEKEAIIFSQAQQYTPPSVSKMSTILTISGNMLSVNAGVDESNVESGLLLLPENAYASAQKIWHFLREQYNVKEVGVVITDSVSMPLLWGVVGRALSHCGFEPLFNRIGENDLYGREIKMTQMAISQGIAAAAVLEMGEVAESTPLCLVTDITAITFQDSPPTQAEIDAYAIDVDDDVFGPLLKNAPWQKGGKWQS